MACPWGYSIVRLQYPTLFALKKKMWNPGIISGIYGTFWFVSSTCVSKLTIIGSDNDLSPDRRQAIIWTNAGILLIRTLGTNFSDFLTEIRAFSFKKMHLKMSSGKWRPSCLGLNVLNCQNEYHTDAWWRALYVCVGKQGHHWFRFCAKPLPEPSWNIANSNTTPTMWECISKLN